ncbi:MAG: hypothetical protein ACRDYA_08405 [Egibacteraceae bacterium]
MPVRRVAYGSSAWKGSIPAALHGGFPGRLTDGVSVELIQQARTPVLVTPPDRT